MDVLEDCPKVIHVSDFNGTVYASSINETHSRIPFSAREDEAELPPLHLSRNISYSNAEPESFEPTRLNFSFLNTASSIRGPERSLSTSRLCLKIVYDHRFHLRQAILSPVSPSKLILFGYQADDRFHWTRKSFLKRSPSEERHGTSSRDFESSWNTAEICDGCFIGILVEKSPRQVTKDVPVIWKKFAAS